MCNSMGYMFEDSMGECRRPDSRRCTMCYEFDCPWESSTGECCRPRGKSCPDIEPPQEEEVQDERRGV